MLTAGGCAVWAGTQGLRVQGWTATVWGSFYLIFMFIADRNQKNQSNRG
jgi:hypothetical protein